MIASDTRKEAGLPDDNHEVSPTIDGRFACRSCSFVGTLTEACRHVVRMQPVVNSKRLTKAA